MNDKILCIHHGGCDDGFAAAWAVESKYPGQVEHVPGVYQTEPPDCTDREVVIVDFSYKLHVMEKIAFVAKSILVLDHHKTARDDLVLLLREGVIDGEFDMERSGAMMAWDYYHGKGNHPPIIDYVQDRDLWRMELPDSIFHSMALRSYRQDFKIWDGLTSEALIEEGKPIYRYYRGRLDEVRRNARVETIAGHAVPVCNAPWFMASDLAGELAFGLKFAAVYWDTADRRTYSLRSRGDGGIDVSEVAKKFGGGGHAGAAGFTVDRDADVSV